MSGRVEPRVASQLAHGRNVNDILSVGVESEALGDLPDEDLAIFRRRGDDVVVERVPRTTSAPASGGGSSSGGGKVYQSVSRTEAVCPRNSGIWSGTFPRSFRGMTANAPPPDASQLTERYSGLTYSDSQPPLYQRCGGTMAAAPTGARKTHLDQVCVPSIAADVDVVVAEFLSRRLAKDVSWRESSACLVCLAQRNLCEFAPTGTVRHVRYLEARTKRPAMMEDGGGVDRVDDGMGRECKRSKSRRRFTREGASTWAKDAVGWL